VNVGLAAAPRPCKSATQSQEWQQLLEGQSLPSAIWQIPKNTCPMHLFRALSTLDAVRRSRSASRT